MNNQVLVDLLRDERNYRRVNMSCQLGMVDRCLCILCRDLRIDEALATPAPIPDAGEGVDVVAYLNTATGEVAVYGPTIMDWDDEDEPVESLITVAQHARIVRALQASAMVVPDNTVPVDRTMLKEVLRDLPHTNLIAGYFRRLLAASPAPGDDQ